MISIRKLAAGALMAAAAVIAAAPGVAYATSYDLNADWSDVSNPNGVWTLREGLNALPSVANWQGFNNPAWAPSNDGGDFLPGFLKANGVGSDDCATCNWLAGDVVVHTTDFANGRGEGVANVLFVTPFSGTADIAGLTWAGRSIGRTQGWDLLINGVSQGGGSLPGDGTNGRGSPDLFSFSNIVLNTGDQVELRLFQQSGDALGDFVGLNVHVDLTASGAVPEPASWGLMFVGFAGVGTVLRRRPRTAAAATA